MQINSNYVSVAYSSPLLGQCSESSIEERCESLENASRSLSCQNLLKSSEKHPSHVSIEV